MATIASLNIGIRVNSERLNRDLARSRKDVRRFADSAGRRLTRFGRAAGVAIAGVTTALVLLSRQSVTTSRDIKRMADASAFGARQFQQLRNFAMDLGLPLDLFPDLSKDLQDKITEIRDGNKSIRDDFALLGLGLDSFSGEAVKDIESFYEGVARTIRLRGATVAQGIVARALDIGGDSALAIVRGIEAGLLDAAGDASRIITDEALDNLNALGTGLEQVAQGFQVGFSNALGEAIGQTVDWRKAVERANMAGASLFEFVVGVAERLWQWRGALRNAAIGLGVLFGAKLLGGIGLIIADVYRLGRAIAALAIPAIAAAAPWLGIIASIAAATVLVRALGRSWEASRDSYKSFAQSLSVELAASNTRAVLAVVAFVRQSFITAIEKVVDAVNAVISAVESGLREIPGLGDLDIARAGTGFLDGLRADVAGLHAEIAALDALREDARPASDYVRGLAQQSIAARNSVVDDVAATAEAVGDAFVDGFKAVADRFRSEADSLLSNVPTTAPSLQDAFQDSRFGALADFGRSGLSFDRREDAVRIAQGFGAGSGRSLIRGIESRDGAAPGAGETAESWVADFNQNLRSEFAGSLSSLDFGDFARNVLGRLQQSLAESLTDRLFDFIGGLFGGGGGGFGSLFARTMHEGGYVPGRPGQEVPILAEAGELVLNARQQEALFGGAGVGSVTVNINATGDVTTATRRALLSSGREVADIVHQRFRERRVLP